MSAPAGPLKPESPSSDASDGRRGPPNPTDALVKHKAKRSIVRVRTGCITCKIRRVKCDEQRPSCNRCISTGRTCDGYLAVKSAAVETTSFYNIPFHVPGSQHDRQTLHYYIVHAAPDLSGFSVGAFELWAHEVLQRSHHEPVIRTAVLALASAHRDYATNQEHLRALTPDASILGGETVKAYNKALRLLRKHMSTATGGEKSVVLLCCAIFFCFENLRGQPQWARRHLDAGLNMLRGYELVPFPLEADDISQSLIQGIVRLDMTESLCHESRMPFFQQMSGNLKVRGFIPSQFSSLAQAQTYLDTIQNWATAFLSSHFHIKPYLSKDTLDEETIAIGRTEADAIRDQHTSWGSAFDNLLANGTQDEIPSPGLSRQHSIARLRVQQAILAALIPVDYPCIYGTNFDTIQAAPLMLEAAEAIAEAQRQSNGYAKGSFTGESGVVPSLFILATKSRTATIRTRALTVLRTWPRREAALDTAAMARLLDSVTAIQLLETTAFPAESDCTSIEEWGRQCIVQRLEPISDLLSIDYADRGSRHELLELIGIPNGDFARFQNYLIC